MCDPNLRAGRGHTPACTGAVLTGGLGSRLGGGKAGVDLGGRPMTDWVIGAVRAAGLEPLLVDDRGAGGVVHPLAGIVAALERVGAPVVVVACDVPFVDPDLLRALARTDGAAMVRGNPLIARYEPHHLPQLRAALEAQAPLRATIAALDPLVIEGDVENVNTPEDLARARSIAAAARSRTLPSPPRTPPRR